MAIHDLTSERLFVDTALAQGARVELSEDQTHYLVNVLRSKIGAGILVFNGRDGEWRARLIEVKKRSAVLEATEQTRPQIDGPDIDYLFAPLKHARLDYMVQKAVEMGVAKLSPVQTRRTVPDRVNLERMRANAIEAAEQCGILRVPEISELRPLVKVLDGWDAKRTLIFCDEGDGAKSPVATLRDMTPGPLAVLIGPEGGFSDEERQLLRARPYVIALSLGPRIMRADTAAVAALALVNATLGDWGGDWSGEKK
jgi:16S rRNA (uracil1498-N3)-methyltransferase